MTEPAADVDRRRVRRLTAARSRTQPLRVAFVGQAIYFEQCALSMRTAELEPAFVDFRAGANAAALRSRLNALDPDVILVFRPEIIPARMFASVRALTIGYLTEPLPRDPQNAHSDLRERLRWLGAVDPSNFDRIVSFDPLIAETASSVLPVWRSLPIPVDDQMFLDVRERFAPPRLLFIGRSTAHREQLLAQVKARHPVTHIGHGLYGPRLARFLRAADVQLNLHNNPYPTFENRVCVALASGHLVISEPLSPAHDLQPGRDLLEIRDAESLGALADELRQDQSAYLDVQHAGRAQAERFRASAVYPRLIEDARTDVAERGGRPRGE